MPVTADQSAPYAPASAILDVVNRHRSRGLPSPVDADVLARAGISPSLIPRTLYALQTLDLIDEKGSPTEVLEGIRLAPEPEYQQRLADWLRAAYADALVYIDPATADESQIRDAFRSYQPIGQKSRMVSLFTGLFAAAGTAPEKPERPPRQPDGASAPQRWPTPSITYIRNEVAERFIKFHGTAHHHIKSSGLPAPLAGLLATLPQDGTGWSKSRRDQFVETFEAVLDFCIPVGTEQRAARQ